MKISYNWLKNYVAVNLPADEVTTLLTHCGLEVESIEKFETIKGGLKGVIIGEVLEKQKHPNADKLSLTKVNVGTGKTLSIVCGAANVEAGQKVAVAMIGAMLYPISGEPFEIKKSKIRGELSEGMICAEDEIGLGASHAGIMILDNNAVVGMPAADYFKLEEDFVFEIGLTPNRADAASHIGVARDLAAVMNASDKYQVSSIKHQTLMPGVDSLKIDNNDLKIEVVVENTKDCIRYSGISISGVAVKESPAWLQNRLKSIGLKPINNVVDVTNFVLFETGQPLHAFDTNKISGKKVIVKNLPAKTRFVTLDEKEHELTGNELMICDENGGMCIAGVFGGINSGVTSETKNIFIESACFTPVSVRKTAKHHGLKTDASFRFERGTDVDITVYALKRAALLMTEICGGKVSSGIVDIYPNPVVPAKINFNFKQAFNLIGAEIDKTAIRNILNDLGIKIAAEDAAGMELKIPNYKTDVKRGADVVEEVLRIYGYNKISLPPKMNMPLPQRKENMKERMTALTSQFLVANGFNELFCNSLSRETYSDLIDKRSDAVNIRNPLSNDLSIMRQTMLFSGLEAIQYNNNRKNTNLRFFETGKTYHLSVKKENDLPFREINHLSLFVTGNRFSESWIKQQPQTYSVYYSKSLLQNLLLKCGIDLNKLHHQKCEHDFLTEALEIFSGKTKLGVYGTIKSSLLNPFDISSDVFYADLMTDEILNVAKSVVNTISEPAKYPSVKRDISMLIGKEVSYADIEELSFETERNLLRSVNLFDVYSGDKIEQGKSSYAISFVLQDQEKTLTDKQIEGVMERLMKAFESKLGAQIRK